MIFNVVGILCQDIPVSRRRFGKPLRMNGSYGGGFRFQRPSP